MEALFSIVIRVLVACGSYLVLRARTFPVVLGLTLIGYGVNVFLFASGRLVVGSAPLALSEILVHPDPLPQALVLTAIVIGFGMTAYTIVLALRANGELDTNFIGLPKEGFGFSNDAMGRMGPPGFDAASCCHSLPVDCCSFWRGQGSPRSESSASSRRRR